MKRSSIVWQFALLAAVGCSAQPEPSASSPPATESTPIVQAEPAVAESAEEAEQGASALTFVSLKVPNMH